MPVPISTDNGLANGNPINDCYGSLTQTAGTVITRVIPPRSDGRACVGSWSYEAAATAHTLTLMTCQSKTTVASDAAASQAVVAFANLPVTYDATLLAANDWCILNHEDGSFGAYMVSSVSGSNVTFSSNLSQKVKAGTVIYFMGAPADHSSRAFTMKASTTTTFIGGDFRVRAAAAPNINEPILVHSNNATNAGTLYYLNFYYD